MSVTAISTFACRAAKKLVVHAGAFALAAALVGFLPNTVASESPLLANNRVFKNDAGLHATFSSAGPIDLSNEFFQELGTNGRSCVNCHMPAEAWSITPEGVRKRFERTKGKDPIFRVNDGSNSPNADVSTIAARRAAYSMLLTRGLIRVGLGVPADAEFELAAVDDPYGFANASELSLFRRPLPSTNLKFLSTVMWDGRETFPGQSIHFDLRQQANSANTGHAQGPDLTEAQRESIVAFETVLFTAQIHDHRAGRLTARGANGGAVNLSNQEFYIGINDLFGDSETGAPFDPIVFNIYDAWKGLSGGGKNRARAAVARGQELFNTKLIRISGVSGINDEEDFGKPAVVNGSCTTCHDTPNSGNHSVAAPLNLGLTDFERRTPDMPLYTLRNKATGELKLTTDPGRALVTGKWKDIGRFKGPILRALAARPPYFHDGSAKDLKAVIDFYDDRFGIGFTAQEKADLLAFLRTL
jgi:hypothetical protein